MTKRGRPKSEKPPEYLHIRCDARDKVIWKEVASREGMKELSAYIRFLLQQKAKEHGLL